MEEAMADIGAREALSQAIRYWEPRRILYDALLLVEVVIVFVVNLSVGISCEAGFEPDVEGTRVHDSR
jgi:hypothetical protein